MCLPGLFGGGGRPSAPPPPPLPPPLPPVPRPTDPEITRTRDKQVAAAALARGKSSNILTGGLGLTTRPSTTPKGPLGIG